MSMVGCLFCKRKLRLYKLSMAYSETSHPVKHYIIEFLGPCEEFLDDDYGVCDDCVLVVNKLVYIKKCMYWILVAARQGEYNNTPNLKFSHVYKRFLENLTKLSYGNVETDVEIEEHSTELEASIETNSESSGGGGGGDGEEMNEHEVAQSLDNAGIVQNGDLQWNRMQWNLMPSSHKCTDCSMEYDTLKELTKHKADYHEMPLLYVCPDCTEEKFVSEEDLQLHRHEVHGPQTLQCFLCSVRLRSMEELQRHIREHTCHSYPCSYCDSLFPDAQTCRTHMLENHRENHQATAREEVEEADTDQSNSNLLRELGSSPYDERRESQYAHRYGTPVTNREVQRLLNRKRRKKRGHNWTRRKGWRSKSRISMYSEPIMRAGSRYSTGTGFSDYYNSERGYSDNEEDQEVARNMRNAGVPRNGILRSNRAYSCWTEPTADTNYDDVAPVYECGLCDTEFDTLKEMTEHKVLEHCMLANYVCYECYDAKFVSPEDLKLHNDQMHRTLISHCFLCSLELRTVEDLQRHLREHNNVRHRSYRCNYCDLSFLNRRMYRAHRRDAHKGQRGRFQQLKKCTILDRIHRSRSRSPIQTPAIDDTYNNQVIWRLQRRPSVPSLSSLCIDVIRRFYSGDVDIEDFINGIYNADSAERRQDNREEEELSDCVSEERLEVQSEMTIACNGSSDNGLDIENSPGGNDESELIEIDNVAEVDVYTFVGSDEESRSETECLLISNDRFETFASDNKMEGNALNDSGSTDAGSGLSSLLVNCRDDVKSSNRPKRDNS